MTQFAIDKAAEAIPFPAFCIVPAGCVTCVIIGHFRRCFSYFVALEISELESSGGSDRLQIHMPIHNVIEMASYWSWRRLIDLCTLRTSISH